MGENWVTLLEHHVTFGGMLALMIGVGKYYLKTSLTALPLPRPRNYKITLTGRTGSNLFFLK